MRPAIRTAFVILPGLAAALGVWSVRTHRVVLVPGSSSWARLVAGASLKGTVRDRARVILTGWSRDLESEVRIGIRVTPEERPILHVSLDQGPLEPLRVNRGGQAVLTLAAADAPGARMDIVRGEGEPPLALDRVEILHARGPWRLGALVASLLSCAVAGLLMARGEPVLAFGSGLFAAGSFSLAASPVLLWLTLPSPASLMRLLAPIACILASLAVIQAGRAGGRRYWVTAGLIAAGVFGAWVRWYFLPSAGSWDTEYWKAWMMRSVSHGVTRVYGEADSLPEGHFANQLLGREELWRVEYHGRDFVVDYPPLAMAAWKASWSAATFLMPWLNRAEAENAAVKLPAVLGDAVSVLLLLWVFRDRPWRGLPLAALYWVLPVSWLSSATLGYLDGAYAPLAAAALVTAGRGWALPSGALLAAAALIKPQAIIVAPAVAAALWASKARLRRALAGAAMVGVAVWLPFVFAGTLSEAVVHVFRIFFQQRLSAGFANPWWLIGHIATAAGKDVEALRAPVVYARLDSVPFPAGIVGVFAFGLMALAVSWSHRKLAGSRAACLSGAALVFAYAMFAVGVHENHPHLLFLALAATGMTSLRQKVVAAILSASYVLNMLVLSGLGRFYGTRYAAVVPLAAWVSGLRMSPGFDLSLALALANTVLFVVFMAGLGRALERLQGDPPFLD